MLSQLSLLMMRLHTLFWPNTLSRRFDIVVWCRGPFGCIATVVPHIWLILHAFQRSQSFPAQSQFSLHLHLYSPPCWLAFSLGTNWTCVQVHHTCNTCWHLAWCIVMPRSLGTEMLLRRIYAGREYPHVYTLSINTVQESEYESMWYYTFQNNITCIQLSQTVI